MSDAYGSGCSDEKANSHSGNPPDIGASLLMHPFCIQTMFRTFRLPVRPPERTVIMSEKKYTVVCNGTTVEVTKEVYNAYNSELRYEDRHRRTKTVSRIEIDMEKEKITFVPSREDSLDRLIELGFEQEDTSFSIEAIDTAVMVEQALDQLSFEERYIIESLFYNGKTESDLAKEFQITQQNINYKKNKILAKLNKIIRGR